MRSSRFFTAAAGAACLLAFFPAGAAADPPYQLEGDFETGDLTGWSFSGNETTHVDTDPVRAGSYAAHMHLDPSEATVYRSELVAGDLGRVDHGLEYWIGFSFHVATWNDPPPSWATLFQFHAVPGDENWDCVAGRNPITITLSDGQLGIAAITEPYTGPPPVPGGAIASMVWEEPVEPGRWYDGVVHLLPSLTDGILEVWIDGVRRFTQTGGNVDLIDDCGVEMEPWVYLKIGIYKDRENTSTQDLYYDEVRIYQAADGYDLVVPGGPISPEEDAEAPAEAEAEPEAAAETDADGTQDTSGDTDAADPPVADERPDGTADVVDAVDEAESEAESGCGCSVVI